MIAPVVPTFTPAAAASPRGRDLVQADDHRVALELAGARLHGAHAVLAEERLDLGAEVQVHAAAAQRLVDGLGDVGIEQLGQRPRALVDEVDLEPAVAEVARHLDADRRAAEDDDLLHVVELFVELHRGADVLDVVQPVEVGARDVGLLPRPAGADRELVEALVGVAGGDRAAVEVDVGDRRLHPHVEPVLDVALDGREEQRLELVDLAAVDERDAARRVRDVRELREQRDLHVRRQALGDGGGRGAGATTPDDDQALGHGSSVRYSISGGAAKVFETQHRRRAFSM